MPPQCRGFAIAIACMLLGGCATGDTHEFAEVPVALRGVTISGTAAIAIHDARPPGGMAAAGIRDALARALKERGAILLPVAPLPAQTNTAARARLVETRAQRQVLVTLREWRPDTRMMSTDFHYDITVAVFDRGGDQLAHHSLRGKDELGNLGLSPGEAIAKAMAGKLDALFEDSRIAGALR